jgi:hypothetical protein
MDVIWPGVVEQKTTQDAADAVLTLDIIVWELEHVCACAAWNV